MFLPTSGPNSLKRKRNALNKLKIFKKDLSLFYVYEHFTCMYVCVPYVCVVPIRARGGIGSPGRTVSAFNC